MDDIVAWLESLGLAEYAPAFVENRIDAAVLPTLTEQDLKDIGVTRLGDRRKLAMAIAERTKPPTLAETASTPPPSVPPQDTVSTPRPASAERRHLTVMFCDLVGSTALAARLDPEDVREVVRAYQGACAQMIGRYEGFVAQYLGDGVMAYFGYPAAHEDDAERAVRAGLDLIVAVAELATKSKVEVRVGIATGLVVVGDLIGEQGAKERAVTGETPNLAARLQGLAPPGSIVVSAATRRLLGGMFHLHDLGAQQVKGLDAPVQAFAVAGVRTFESRFEARAGGLTGFVGREEECEHLVDRWKLTRQGRGQVVLVSGEAGIGKSRLTAWLVDKVAGEPHTRMRYQCTPHHKDSALYPTIAQIERAAGIEANEAAEAKLAKLEALLALAETEAAETIPLFAALLAIPTGEKYPPLAMSPGQQRQRTLAALLDQVEALARQKPLLMIYEDAHWADATSLELLDSLVDRLARLPVLFVATGRPEFSPAWAGRHNASTVALQKLDKRDTRAMVESVTGGATLPADLLDQIVQKTDGVPLFIEELTKTVLESGVLVEHGSSLRAAAALPIPATLQDSLMARLDRSNPVKEIAQIGAAIAREFSYKLLLAVAGMDEASVRAGLAKLEEAELATRRGVPPDATYTFKHALVQDAAYESLLRSRRQVIHRRIARALRDRFPELADAEPEVVAHHFTKGGRPARAAEWWARAGRVATRRGAYAEALGHFTRAVQLADEGKADRTDPSERLQLQIAYRNAMIAIHGWAAPEVTAAYHRSAELAAAIDAPIGCDDPDEKMAGVYGNWLANYVGGHAVEALRLSHAYSQQVQDGRSDAERLFAVGMIGRSQIICGDFSGAVRSLESYLSQYDVGKHLSLALRPGVDEGSNILAQMPLALYPIGRIDDACRVAEEAIAHAHGTQDLNNIVFVHGYLCNFEAMRGNTPKLRERALHLKDLSLKHDFKFWVVVSELWLSVINAAGTTAEAAFAQHQQCMAVMTALRTLLIDPIVAFHQAELVRMIAPTNMLAILDGMLAKASTTGAHFFDAELHRKRGRALRLASPSRLDVAEAAYHRALAIAQSQGAKTFEVSAALDLARLYCDTGRERAAVPLLEGALVGFTETPALPEIGEARRLLQSLA